MEAKTVGIAALVAIVLVGGFAFAAPAFGNSWQNAQDNPDAHEAFLEAVRTGDYATASELHEEYGFGGPMFDKLDETTFAKFAQARAKFGEARALMEELRSELGLEMPARGEGIGPRPFWNGTMGDAAPGDGEMMGQRGGFLKGSRHGFRMGGWNGTPLCMNTE